MTEPAEEIYVVYNRVTGDIKTGGGSSTKPSVHAYKTESEAWKGSHRLYGYGLYQGGGQWGVAKYRLVETEENRE
nr:MAG TPA: hypothetical protein [Caudoviricetes sp.]